MSMHFLFCLLYIKGSNFYYQFFENHPTRASFELIISRNLQRQSCIQLIKPICTVDVNADNLSGFFYFQQ